MVPGVVEVLNSKTSACSPGNEWSVWLEGRRGRAGLATVLSTTLCPDAAGHHLASSQCPQWGGSCLSPPDSSLGHQMTSSHSTEPHSDGALTSGGSCPFWKILVADIIVGGADSWLPCM